MTYLCHIVIFFSIYSILALSMNLEVGVTGLFNLGHIAFFGIGAYTSALLSLKGLPFLPSLFAGALLASVIGCLIGIPTLKLKGDYLAIATLGLGETIRAVLKNWMSLTRGPLGLPGIPKPTIFSIEFINVSSYMVLALIFLALTFVFMEVLLRSPYGRVLRGIREDEVAAQAMGKNTFRSKLSAFWVGCFFAGVAGALYAHYVTFIDPTPISIYQTILILLMVVLGGMGSNVGALLGTLIVIGLPELLRFWNLPGDVAGALKQLVFSTVLILLVLFRREGILGGMKADVKRFESADDDA